MYIYILTINIKLLGHHNETFKIRKYKQNRKNRTIINNKNLNETVKNLKYK